MQRYDKSYNTVAIQYDAGDTCDLSATILHVLEHNMKMKSVISLHLKSKMAYIKKHIGMHGNIGYGNNSIIIHDNMAQNMSFCVFVAF